MSANHNRIKVSDLETNQPNRTLITNENGELEFSASINSYNGLDYTLEGKTLDARQGKVLKDNLENLNLLLNQKEETFNKVQDIQTNKSSTNSFPSVKAIYDWTKGLFKTWILGIESFSDTNYFLNIENINKRTVFLSSNSVLFSIPSDSIFSFPIGTRKEITQKGTGVVTITSLGVNFVTNALLSMVQGETRILTKIGPNEWTIESTNLNGILSTVSNEFTEIQKFNKGGLFSR